jgi:hypothetical protein
MIEQLTGQTDRQTEHNSCLNRAPLGHDQRRARRRAEWPTRVLGAVLVAFGFALASCGGDAVDDAGLGESSNAAERWADY